MPLGSRTEVEARPQGYHESSANKFKTPFPFLRLPRELRDKVYRELLVCDQRLPFPSPHMISPEHALELEILKVKALRAEAINILTRGNIWVSVIVPDRSEIGICTSRVDVHKAMSKTYLCRRPVYLDMEKVNGICLDLTGMQLLNKYGSGDFNIGYVFAYSRHEYESVVRILSQCTDRLNNLDIPTFGHIGILDQLVSPLEQMRGLSSVRHNFSCTGALYKRLVPTMTSSITSNLEAVDSLQRIKDEGNISFRQKRLLEATMRYEDVQHACVWLLPHLTVSNPKGDDLTPRANQLKSILIDASLNWCVCFNQINANYANDPTFSHKATGVGFNLLNQTREFLENFVGKMAAFMLERRRMRMHFQSGKANEQLGTYMLPVSQSQAEGYFGKALREYYHASKLNPHDPTIQQSRKRMEDYLETPMTEEEADFVTARAYLGDQQEMCWRGDGKLLKRISLERGLHLLPLMQIRPEEGKSEEWNDRTLFSYRADV